MEINVYLKSHHRILFSLTVSGNDLKFNGKKVVPGFSSSRQVNRLGGVTNSNSLSALSMIGTSNNKQGFGG